MPQQCATDAEIAHAKDVAQKVGAKLIVIAIVTFLIGVAVTALFVWAANSVGTAISEDIAVDIQVNMPKISEYTAYATLAGIMAVLSFTLPFILMKGNDLIQKAKEAAESR